MRQTGKDENKLIKGFVFYMRQAIQNICSKMLTHNFMYANIILIVNHLIPERRRLRYGKYIHSCKVLFIQKFNDS